MNQRHILDVWLQMLFTLVEKQRVTPKVGTYRSTPEEFADVVQHCLWEWRRGRGGPERLAHALVNLVELIWVVERGATYSESRKSSPSKSSCG
jgi:hypothetical protein